MSNLNGFVQIPELTSYIRSSDIFIMKVYWYEYHLLFKCVILRQYLVMF